MPLILHPRAAPGDRLQVWLGAFGFTNPPVLRWFLDGQEANPNVLRPISSAREVPALAAADEPRVFTGVYEFGQGIAPGSVHEVQAEARGNRRVERTAPLRVRTLPARVPSRLDESFNVLLVSCFHQSEDRGGLAGNLISQLPGAHRPHLTLLLGDQVYLDLPTLMNFRDRVGWLAGKFEEDYTANWLGPLGYSRILGAAPSASIPDDHEYWNNAPHPSPFIQNSWTPGGRERWQQAAKALYDAFQLSQPGGYAEPLVIDVPPLSIFLMDNRTFRSPGLRSTLPGGVLQKFQHWGRRLAAGRAPDEPRFGIVVTGQSLFEDPALGLEARAADRRLANYGDYSGIMRTIMDLALTGRPVLCVTGDVHYGRVTLARSMTGAKLYEIISSPSSLVTTVGKDQFSQLASGFRALFREPDPWPRHSPAAEPPQMFSPKGLLHKLRCEMVFPGDRKKDKGNNVALLSFRAAGFGLEMRVSYWMIERSGRIGPPRELAPITLAPTR